jgi:hypothetical protein
MSRKQTVTQLIVSGVLSFVLITAYLFFADPLEFHGILHIVVFTASLIQFLKIGKSQN